MKKIFFLIILMGFLAGCTSKPMIKIYDEPISGPIRGEQKSFESVSEAIMSGAQKSGWVPIYIRPGIIEANLLIKEFRVKVEIPYTIDKFSINYISSENLDYDGKSIHKNYNKWLIKLYQCIQIELNNRYRTN